jgi:hypothetical protein
MRQRPTSDSQYANSADGPSSSSESWLFASLFYDTIGDTIAQDPSFVVTGKGGVSLREKFQLILWGTDAVESGGSVRTLKRDEQPLVRGESSGFVDLLLSRHVAKHTDQETRMWVANS